MIEGLGGKEKIDIVQWSEDPVQFISAALSPAKELKVTIDEKKKTAQVETSQDQLSLAIGKDGQNVRLAAKLTGWKIDVRTAEEGESKAKEKEKKKTPKKKNEKKNKKKS